MAQSSQEFWADVRHERALLEKACNEAVFQPKNANDMCDGTVYMRSLRHRDRGTIAGDIVLMPIGLAGQRVAEGTHEICPDDAIEIFMGIHERRRREFLLAKQKENTQYVVNITEQVEATAPTNSRRKQTPPQD